MKRVFLCGVLLVAIGNAATVSAAPSVTNGLVLWLNAGALSGLTNGEAVAAWPDGSGAAYDATQTSISNQPAFVTNVLNGMAVVRFDGTNDFLDGPATPISAQTIFLVAKLEPGAPILSGVFCEQGRDANNIRAFTPTTWNAPGNGANVADFCLNGASFVNGRPGFTHANQFHILAQVASEPKMFPYRLSQPLVLNGKHRNFKGDLAEILIYDRELTAIERGQVGYELERKYGLTTAYGRIDNSSGASGVTASIATLNGNLYDTDGGQATTVGVCWGRTDGGAAFGTWEHTNTFAAVTEPRDFALPVTGLTSTQTYYYRFLASNAVAGVTWSESAALFRTGFALSSGHVAFWVSADAVPGAVNGLDIAAWPDLSGHGTDALQDDPGSRPAWTNAAAGGKPAVRFSGAQMLSTIGLAPSWPTTNTTVFLVEKADTLEQSSYVLQAQPDDSGNRFNMHVPWGNGNVYWDFGSIAGNTGRLYYANTAATNWNTWVFERSASGMRIARNAITEALKSGGDSFNPAGKSLAIGRALQGDVAEVIVFDRRLDWVEEAEVGSYLEQKYGLDTAYQRVDNEPGAGDITRTTATLNGTLSSTDGNQSTVVNFFWGASDGGDTFDTWEHTDTVATVTAPQTVSRPITGLSPATLYFYRMYASNAVSGGVWAEASARFETKFSSVNDGLVLWLDAVALRGATNGADVTTWQDGSGSGNHAIAAAAPRIPRFYDAQVGNQPVVRFDGTDDYMDGPGANVTAQTVFMVLKVETNAPTLSGVFAQKGADSQNIRTHNVTDWRFPGTTANTADFCLNGALYVNGSRTPAHNNEYHILEEVSDDAPSFQYRLSQTRYNRYFRGDLAEVIVYDRTLTVAERGEVGRYLAGKYGIEGAAYGTVVLPDGADDPMIWYDVSQQATGTNGQSVATLIDYSGNNNHGNAANPGSGVLVTNAAGGLPVVRLDGDNAHYYAFPLKNNIRTVFWVLSEQAGATPGRFVLGDSRANRTYHFHRDTSANSYIWSQDWSGLMVNGTTKLDGTVVDGRATKMPTTPSILSVRTSGNATANSLSNDRGITDRNWQGDVAEVLIYNRVLSEAEERAIGLYLARKYSLDTTYARVDNLPPTRIAQTSAELNGVLVEASTDDPVTITVYWGPDDGGTNVANWATNHTFGTYGQPAVFSLPVTNLLPLTTTYYRFRGEDAVGTTWAADSAAVRTRGHGVTNGLQLWLDASSLSGLADGERVPSLVDWSGLENHASQSDTNAQPVFKPDVTNGQAMVRFDGVASVMEGFKPFTAKTILALCRVDPTAPNLTGVFCQQNADAQNIRALTPTTWNAPGNSANTGDFCYNGKVTIDGVSGFTHANRYHLLHEVAAGLPTFQYRLSQPLYDRFFKGDVGEILVYNRELTVVEQYELGEYFANRYGLATDYPIIDVTDVVAVGMSEATVGGNLAVSNATVRLYYGTADGGFDPGGWTFSATATNQGIGDVAVVATGLVAETTYYARYYATNNDTFGWSRNVVAFFTQPVIPVTDGMSLWFTANALSSGHPDGQRVATWPDLSGNGRDGTANVNGNPVFESNVAGGLPVVRFDGGTNTFFTFARLDDIRTVFWVIREDADATFPRFLLGSEGIGNIYHFHRDPGATKYMWGANTHANVRDGVTMLNGEVVDGTTTPVPTDRLAVISVRTTGNVSANAFVSDRFSQGVRPARTWDGDLAELIIYNRALSDEEEQQVGKYLARRYGLQTRYTPSGTLLLLR